ncbi:MAG: arylsulfatase [Rhizobiales bacterium]|nr:arylsulfatase [Hyphomicrobiales bacterium]
MTTAALNQPPRIALVHALEESVLPARAALRELWPEAAGFDLLDTALAVDLAARGELDQDMVDRFLTLGRYAAATRGTGGPAAAMLFTCSAFGPAIDAVKKALPIPVFRPNEAAFSEALGRGASIAILVSFPPSLPSLTRELQDEADARGLPVTIKGIVAEGALAALKAGDGEGHDRLVAEAAAKLSGVDAIILGQFSLARARQAVEAVSAAQVITTPDAAVRALRAAVEAEKRG